MIFVVYTCIVNIKTTFFVFLYFNCLHYCICYFIINTLHTTDIKSLAFRQDLFLLDDLREFLFSFRVGGGGGGGGGGTKK